MGLVYRCPSCCEPMVLESFHSGRTVPCPHCRERLDVPPHLDFERVIAATLRDASRARLLLSVAVAFVVLPVFPVCAFVWWSASGRIHLAEEDGREVDPLLRLARAIARVGTFTGGLVAVLLVLGAV